MAGTTRLELATSAVTGQRSNQLNYVPNLTLIVSNIFRASRVLAATGSQLMRRLVRLRRPTVLLPPTLPFLAVFANNRSSCASGCRQLEPRDHGDGH